MKQIIITCVALVLAACGQGPAPSTQAQTAKPETTSAAAPATPPTPTALEPTAPATSPSATSEKPPGSEGPQLTAAMIVGRWGDNGDCTKDILINADGTFRSYTGGGGTWSLNGDRLRMTGANGTGEVRVSIINTSTLVITNPDGSVGTSQRC
jgi:hypothetical protein